MAAEAKNEGYPFVQKTIDEWNQKINCFSMSGEILLGVFIGEKCIGIGGLNVDPYDNDPSIGRGHHLYISKRYRRQGIAKDLSNRIIRVAQEFFTILRGSTNNPVAAKFYETMGAKKSDKLKQTHALPNLKIHK